MSDARAQPARPVVLCVLDGWGYREEKDHNAILPANTPNFQTLLQAGPHALINTSGDDVGLPHGQMGNSEVGHMNLGAGRVVKQHIHRIDAAIENGSFATNTALSGYIDTLRSTGGTCHLMGLVSSGGVHSHQDHLVILSKLIGKAGVPVAIHAFLDGRDTPPSSAITFIKQLERQIAGIVGVHIVTVSGRFYAMDRDQRWERVGKVFDTIVCANGTRAPDAASAITASYAAGLTDEFVEPTVIGGYRGVRDGDGVLMGNFRADRAREILLALLDPDFKAFDRSLAVKFSAALGLTEYSSSHNKLMETMFPSISMTNILGEIVSKAGMRQLRIAETEKYAHVTFFFNGGEETPFPGEDRILIPSPKVPTYDLKPEMSSNEVTTQLIKAITSDVYDFILVNYANPDMVGHTGILDAAKTAISAVDHCLGALANVVRNAGGVMLVTADHGNAELMRDLESGEPHTAHTLNVVPALLVNAPRGVTALNNGRLADIAPTLLRFLDLDQPTDMTGTSLLVNNTAAIPKTSKRVPA